MWRIKLRPCATRVVYASGTMSNMVPFYGDDMPVCQLTKHGSESLVGKIRFSSPLLLKSLSDRAEAII